MKQIMNHVRRYRALLAGIVILTILQVGSSLLSPTILATLRNTNICDTNQCQYNLWVNWLVHKIV